MSASYSPEPQQQKVAPIVTSEGQQEQSWFSSVGHKIEHWVEDLFFSVGKFVASKPWYTLAGVFLVVALCGAGMTQFYQENRDDKLWIPQGTQALKNRDFFLERFSEKSRSQEIIIVRKDKGNILQPDSMKEIAKLWQAIVSLTPDTKGACGKIAEADRVSWSNRGLFLPNSVLSPWSQFQPSPGTYDSSAVESLNSVSQILTALNSWLSSSANSGRPVEPSSILGNVKNDGQNQVSSAEAARFFMLMKEKGKLIDGNEVDEPAECWETKLLELASRSKGNYQTIDVYISAERSSSDAFSAAITGDLSLVSTGYLLIIGYSAFVLFNRKQLLLSRATLSVAGVLAVGLAIICSFGLSSALGQFYGPVHSVLPFLLLGIGVDDMFVIVNAIDQVDIRLDMVERIGLGLKSAGASITVTSLTDLLAFLIGATTSLPALSSFCIYAGIGVLFTFAFQITFFVAAYTIDNRRKERGGRDCLCCSKPMSFDKEQLYMQGAGKSSMRSFLGDKFAPFILQKPVRYAIMITTAGFLAASIYGATQLRQEFSFRWFVPDNSYLQKIFDLQDQYFPSSGINADIVTVDVDYCASQAKLSDFSTKLKSNKWVEKGTVSSWYDEMKAYFATNSPSGLDSNGQIPCVPATNFLNQFNVWAASTPAAKASAERNVIVKDGKISASRIGFRVIQTKNSREDVQVLNSIRQLVKDVNLAGTFEFAFPFLYFEQYLIIERELILNIGLAAVAVFFVSLALIAHPGGALLVFSCVIMTIVELLGCMWFWGIGIDGVAVINIVLALGFSVDYSAHIGHCYMVKTGSRIEKAKQALGDIGFSVINGAVSTFLAVLLLSVSQSYVFRVFFRMFFLVVLCGCFNGVVLLPCMLATFGPSRTASQNSKNSKELLGMGEPVQTGAAPMDAIAAA